MTEVLHEVREEELQTLAAYLSAREP
jgi:hypothetical protein